MSRFFPSSVQTVIDNTIKCYMKLFKKEKKEIIWNEVKGVGPASTTTMVLCLMLAMVTLAAILVTPQWM